MPTFCLLSWRHIPHAFLSLLVIYMYFFPLLRHLEGRVIALHSSNFALPVCCTVKEIEVMYTFKRDQKGFTPLLGYINL